MRQKLVTKSEKSFHVKKKSSGDRNVASSVSAGVHYNSKYPIFQGKHTNFHLQIKASGSES